MQGATTYISPYEAEVTWRVQFAIGLAIIIAVFIYRGIFLKESAVWEAERKEMKKSLEHKGVRRVRRSRSAQCAVCLCCRRSAAHDTACMHMPPTSSERGTA
jgi:hypothetical protein